MDRKSQVLVHKYAHAFVDLLIEKNQVEPAFDSVDALLKVLKETNLEQVLGSNAYSDDEKAKLLSNLKEEGADILNNFLDLLVKNGREAYLPAILVEVERELSRRTNRFVLEVSSPILLNEEQKQKMSRLAQAKFGIEVRSLKEVVDPDLLGGFIISANNRVLDTSLRSQLHALRNSMK